MRYEISLDRRTCAILNDRDPALIVEEASKAGAEIVLFPEMYSNGHARFDMRDPAAMECWRKGAQRPDGSFIERFREAARKYQTYAVATFLEAADPKPFTAVAVGDVRIAQMRGRAFEAVLGIAVANYSAPRCDGHSFAVDSIGSVIVMADDSPGVTIAAFDLRLIRKVRAEDRFRWQVSRSPVCHMD